MAEKGIIEGRGRVDECLPGAKFRVVLTELSENNIAESDQKEVLCTISGRMRKNRVRILPGDIVRLEISVYDLEKGRIVFREKV